MQSKLEEQIKRGEEAKRILDSHVFNEAIALIKEGIIAKLEIAPVRDIEGQHKLCLMLQLLNKVTENLRSTLQTGHFAAKELDDKKRIFGLF